MPCPSVHAHGIACMQARMHSISMGCAFRYMVPVLVGPHLILVGLDAGGVVLPAHN